MSRRALAAVFLLACGSDSTNAPGSSVSSPKDGAATRTDGGASTTADPDGGPSTTKRVCLPDPVAAVNGLSDHGVLLGYHLNGFFDPSTTKHWEGVARLRGGGGAYLAVSRIGPEMFDVVELASRKAGGEAFGASRASVSDPPPADDKVIGKVDIDEGFEHAGGLQTLGDVLAVPLENGKASRVVFYDVADPKAPRRLTTVERPDIGEAGSAGLAELPDGRTLLVVGRKGDQTLDFYTTAATDLTGFHLDSTWSVKVDGVKTTIDDTNFGDYQNLDVLRACDDRIYLLGTHREGVLVGVDYVDLFVLELGAKPVITKIAKRHMYCATSGEDAQCNLDAAAGAYVTPSGALHVYAVEHDNDGPGGSIKMKEF
ncbi:MAG: hypothetical protein U0270_09680 [Labilithrix sp.]